MIDKKSEDGNNMMSKIPEDDVQGVQDDQNNNVRVDKIGFGDLIVMQKPEEFCYGVDAVLLAHEAAKYSNQRPGERIIDLGTGTGIVPLILSHKTKSENIYGVEVQTNSYEMCKRNLKANNLEDRLSFINCNVKDIDQSSNDNVAKQDLCGETTLEQQKDLAEDTGAIELASLKGTIDIVTSNPPYTANSCGLTSRNQAKAIARHEIEGTLEDFIKCASILLKDKGHLIMVHRPNRLVDICYLGRKYKLEPKNIEFLSGKEGEKPNLILVHCVKNSNAEIRVEAPSYIRDASGNYSKRALVAYG